MKKKVFFALLAAMMLIIVAIWPREESIAKSASVVFAPGEHSNVSAHEEQRTLSKFHG
jgi:hypothetical protein